MLPSDTPRLPAWPFLLGDAVLLGSAALIAYANPGSLTGGPLVAVVLCLVLGVAVVVIPFMVNYARTQDEALDERQRALEALAQKVANSADQISVAAAGLNGLVETTHRNLKFAEQLPHKLQDKISEFNQQLTQAHEDDREELERELTTLRAAEGERLESAADKAQKAMLELGKAVAAADRRLQLATEALAKADKAGEAGAAKMQQAAAQLAADSAAELVKAVQAAQKSAGDSIGEGIAKAVADFEGKVAASTAAWDDHVAKTLERIDRRIEKLETLSKRPVRPTNSGRAQPEPEVAQPKVETPAESFMTPVVPAEPVSPTSVVVEDVPVPGAVVEVPAITEESPEVHVAEAQPPLPTVETVADPVKPEAELVSVQEPEPIAAAAEPSKEDTLPVEEQPVAAEALLEPVADPEPEAVAAKPARKKATKQHKDDDQPSLGLELEEPARDEFAQESPEESKLATSVSADGATRLLVTAYIGIGNRLYVRGNGPGLSQERGLPLQFVSIGKWRWETAEATTPVRIKLLKNDQLECPMLGEITLEPGHQAEVTANF